MKCPFCGYHESRVMDSRPIEEGSTIRRRRECSNCNTRWTTSERVQLHELAVIKSNRRREPFDGNKLRCSLATALHKRPVDPDRVDQAVATIARRLKSAGEDEISSSTIGGMALNALKDLDEVAYIRFASVFRNFRTPDDFKDFIDHSVRINEAAE